MHQLRFIQPPTLLLLGLTLLGSGACNEHVRLGALVPIPDGGNDVTVDLANEVAPDLAGDGTTDLIGDTAPTSDAETGPNVLWKSTFESNDLTEWTTDSAGGAQVQNAKIAPVVSTDFAHTGRYAGKITVTSQAAMQTANYLYREAPNPTEAYYGAWFYIPSSFTVKTWLSLHHFNSSATGDGRRLAASWDVNLIYHPAGSGTLVAQLFDYGASANQAQLLPIPVPRDTWVHFEVLLVKASTPTGRIAVWQDDVLILEKTNVITTPVVTTPNDWVQWNAGAAADGVDPASAAVYVDDATISTTRVGTAPLP